LAGVTASNYIMLVLFRSIALPFTISGDTNDPVAISPRLKGSFRRWTGVDFRVASLVEYQDFISGSTRLLLVIITGEWVVVHDRS
jgi:hypothetical protein